MITTVLVFMWLGGFLCAEGSGGRSGVLLATFITTVAMAAVVAANLG